MTRDSARARAFDEAMAIVKDQREAFKDPAYAGGPVGAFSEIFACTEILAALSLASEKRDSGSRAERQDRNGLGPQDGRTAPEEGHRPTSGATQEIINRLKEALEPFAREADDWSDKMDCEEIPADATDIKIADLRRAREALSTLTNLTPSGVERIRAEAFDPRTGRPLGDHGTANEAIEFILEYGCEADPFLRAWQQGDLDEWPEFYEWLAALPSEPPSQGDAEGRAREMLAAECDAAHASWAPLAAALRTDEYFQNDTVHIGIVIRAIVKALASKEDGRS